MRASDKLALMSGWRGAAALLGTPCAICPTPSQGSGEIP